MTDASDVAVRASPIEGLGMFAARAFAAGERIRRVNIVREVTPDAPLREDLGERVDHCDYPDGKVVLVGFPDRHANHSCDPNTYVVYEGDDTWFVARRAIAPGEEITLDYSVNTSGGSAWLCHCGAARCRGTVRGEFFSLPLSIQREYQPLLADWFVRRQARLLFTRWMRATFGGWLLGFVIVVLLALATDVIGGGAQFIVGVGMGGGVGYLQSRVLRERLQRPQRWLWASVAGMGVPFVLWDLGGALGVASFFSLLTSVLVGSLLVGLLQQSLLRPSSRRAAWWVPACTLGWTLPVVVLALNDASVIAQPWGEVLSTSAIVFGGAVLGAVTGKALTWVLDPSAARSKEV